MFEYILQDSERFHNFNKAMQARSAQTSLPYDLFPFKDRLGKDATTKNSVLVVDVGGGTGQATFAIRDICRDICGEMVIQDQQQVIEGISSALPEGVTAMAYDFFTPQPIKGNMY
jgi:SAM-dependent methyltransferase